VIALELADLVIIASRTLGLDTGQVLGLLDAAAAERALAQAQPEGEPGSPAAAAAALLSALVRQQPLRRGNQQVALAAMLQFLALNGWDLDPDPPGPVAAMVADVAAGALDVSGLTDRLAPRLRPSGHARARAKEASMPDHPALSLAEKIKRATMRKQPKGMFQRFTDRARRVVVLAQEEARLLGHNHVGTEHLLLALLYEGEGIAARALESLGISRENMVGQVEEITGRGQHTRPGHIPFAPRTKKVLELSLREALALGHHYIGTEHLLLALLRDGEGVGAQVLTRLGGDDARVRERVIDLLTGRAGPSDPRTGMVPETVFTDLVDAAEQLVRVRQQKEAAFDAGDLDTAAALRDQEKRLLADKQRLENQLTPHVDVQAVIAENQRLRREVNRLRDLLRQHGIEPAA